MARSELGKGRVTAEVSMPERAPARALLRLRLPEGYKVASASAGGQALNVSDGETIDLSGRSGRVEVEAKVSK